MTTTATPPVAAENPDLFPVSGESPTQPGASLPPAEAPPKRKYKKRGTVEGVPLGGTPAEVVPGPVAPPAPVEEPWTPYTGADLAPLAGIAFRGVGIYRGFPDAWAIGEPVAGALGDRMAAVANKYRVGGRFKDELALAGAVAFAVWGCLEGESAAKAKTKAEKDAGAPAVEASKLDPKHFEG